MKRNLLSTDYSDDLLVVHYETKEDTYNCVNGYYLNDSFICNCYPGWASDFTGFNLCDIDTGENLTKLNKDIDGIDSPNSDGGENSKKNNNNIMAEIGISFCLFLIILLIIFCVLRCIFKKFKKITSIKKKINSHKNNNEIKESEISLELSSNVDNKNENKVSFNQSKQSKSIIEDKNEENNNNNNSSNSLTKRIIDNSNYGPNYVSVEMEINSPK